MKSWQYWTITVGVILAGAGMSFVLPVENAGAFMFAGLWAWQGLVDLLQLPIPKVLSGRRGNRWTGISQMGFGLTWGVLAFCDISAWYLLATGLLFVVLIVVCEIYGKKNKEEEE